MVFSDAKQTETEEEYVYTALTESERMHLEESMHHNHDLMVRLAQL